MEVAGGACRGHRGAAGLQDVARQQRVVHGVPARWGGEPAEQQHAEDEPERGGDAQADQVQGRRQDRPSGGRRAGPAGRGRAWPPAGRRRWPAAPAGRRRQQRERAARTRPRREDGPPARTARGPCGSPSRGSQPIAMAVSPRVSAGAPAQAAQRSATGRQGQREESSGYGGQDERRRGRSARRVLPSGLRRRGSHDARRHGGGRPEPPRPHVLPTITRENDATGPLRTWWRGAGATARIVSSSFPPIRENEVRHEPG